MSSSSTPTTSPSRLLYGAEDALGIARDHLGVEQRRHLRGVHGLAAHHDAQQPRRVRLDVERMWKGTGFHGKMMKMLGKWSKKWNMIGKCWSNHEKMMENHGIWAMSLEIFVRNMMINCDERCNYGLEQFYCIVYYDGVTMGQNWVCHECSVMFSHVH